MSIKLDQPAVLSNELCEKHQMQKVLLGSFTICRACADELLTQTQIQHAHEVNCMVRDKHFAGAQLPKRHAQSGFRDYIVQNDGQKNAKAECVRYVKDFKSAVYRNLVMVGRTGTGKTHLACAVARNILGDQKYARYVTSADMAQEIANAWSKDVADNEANAIYRFVDLDLLILDEYGLHDRHESHLQLIHKVLYARYDANKPTMLISNLTAQDLAQDLGDRLWSRLQHDELVVIECNWHDQRVGGAA